MDHILQIIQGDIFRYYI